MSSLQVRKEPIEGRADAIVLHIGGDLNQLTLDPFLAALQSARDEGSTRVVLNMEGVGYANSTALGALITEADAFRLAGGGLTLLKPQPKVALVIDSLGLRPLFGIFDTVGEAIDHLGGGSTAAEMRLTCPCGQVLTIPPHVRGRRARCPSCQREFQVPADSPSGKPTSDADDKLRFRCTCGQLLAVARQAAGRRFRCPSCKSIAVAPSS